jgi:hypothetical protein
VRKSAGTGTDSINVPFNNTATVEIQTGTLSLGGLYIQTAGLTRLNGGNLTVAQPLQIQGGTLIGAGTVTGSVTNNGIVSPGASPGLLTITGGYTQTGNGILSIELGGLSAGTGFDRLAVSGAVRLAGTVSVTLLAGFSPATNDTFTFLTAGARNSVFDAFNYATNDLSLALDYTTNTAFVQFLSSTNSICTSAPGGLGAWWRGENNALDSRGANHGTLVNGATFTNGIVGQSFQLDGVDDYVDAGELDVLRGADAITVMAWVKKSHLNTSVGGILGQWNTSPGSDNRFLLYNGEGADMHRGTIVIQLDDGSLASVVGSSNFPVDEWVHVAGVWRSSDGFIGFYKNGVLEGFGTQGAGKVLSSTATATAKIGEWGVVRGQSHKWPGQVDEPMVLDRALSGEEISGIAAAGSAGFCPECAPTPPTLVGWWRGENDAQDSASGIHGTFTNGSFTNAVAGDGFNFTGSQFVQMPDVAPLDFNNAFTIELWVSPKAAGNANGTTFLLGKGNMNFVNTQSYGLLFNDDRRVFIRLGNGSIIDQLPSTTPLPLNTWSHIAATYNGTMMRVYVNGVLENSAPTTITTLLNTSGGLVIGGADFNSSKILSQAAMDEVSIYSGALTAQEIAGIYAAGSYGKCGVACAPSPSGIVSWWRAESNVVDSVSTNHGGLVGNPAFAPGQVGAAYSFDGIDDIAYVPAAGFAAISNDFTVEMWVNPSASRSATEAAPVMKGAVYEQEEREEIRSGV